jgi:hypothetical protein
VQFAQLFLARNQIAGLPLSAFYLVEKKPVELIVERDWTVTFNGSVVPEEM